MAQAPACDISISEFEKIEGGFFSTGYNLFIIRCQTFEQPIKRKAADFTWLHDSLVKEFPLSYVPPLVSTENRANEPNYIFG